MLAAAFFAGLRVVFALVAGRFIAARWNELKLTSPAEFIELRFGRKVELHDMHRISGRFTIGGGDVFAGGHPYECSARLE